MALFLPAWMKMRIAGQLRSFLSDSRNMPQNSSWEDPTQKIRVVAAWPAGAPSRQLTWLSTRYSSSVRSSRALLLLTGGSQWWIMACLASRLGRSTRILFSRRRNMAQSSSLRSRRKWRNWLEWSTHFLSSNYILRRVYRCRKPFCILPVTSILERTGKSPHVVWEKDLVKKRKYIPKIPHVKEIILGDLIWGKNPTNNSHTWAFPLQTYHELFSLKLPVSYYSWQ